MVSPVTALTFTKKSGSLYCTHANCELDALDGGMMRYLRRKLHQHRGL